MPADEKCDSEVKVVVTRANVFSLVKSLMCGSREQLCVGFFFFQQPRIDEKKRFARDDKLI